MAEALIIGMMIKEQTVISSYQKMEYNTLYRQRWRAFIHRHRQML